MWPRRSHMVAPLTKITPKEKIKKTEIGQDAFRKIKQTMARDTLLTYPDFNETFKIHTDAIAFQLGVFIIHKVEPITFYSRRLTGVQKRCTVTEKEPLIIVENLKDFRTISLGQKIIIYTDNKILHVRILILTDY